MADLRPNAGPPNPPLTDERLRQLAYDPIVASNANEVGMALELLELRQCRDRVTDLFESWAAEEAEHRRDGFLGIAEGLNVAIEELRQAVHGEPVNRIPACTACHGEGVVANTRNREPWSAWLGLPSGSDAAVRMGLVRPISCPACDGKPESDAYALDPWTGREQS